MQFQEKTDVPQSDMPCVGTLRWEEKQFPKLPRFPATLSREAATADMLNGWRAYLEARLAPPDASGAIKVEPPMLDGLSYPLSLLVAMRALGLLAPNSKAQLKRILVIGASSRAEERLVRSWREST